MSISWWRHHTAPVLAVQWARLLLFAIALVHIAVPTIMLLQRDDLRSQIADNNPDFSSAELSGALAVTIIAAAIFHAIFLALDVVLIRKLPTGRPWVRWMATIVQVLATLFSIVSFRSSPMFRAVIPVVDFAQIVVVLLLWLPASSRAFFRHPAR